MSRVRRWARHRAHRRTRRLTSSPSCSRGGPPPPPVGDLAQGHVDRDERGQRDAEQRHEVAEDGDRRQQRDEEQRGHLLPRAARDRAAEGPSPAPLPPHAVSPQDEEHQGAGQRHQGDLVGQPEQDAGVQVDAPAAQFGEHRVVGEADDVGHPAGPRIHRHRVLLLGPAALYLLDHVGGRGVGGRHDLHGIAQPLGARRREDPVEADPVRGVPAGARRRAVPRVLTAPGGRGRHGRRGLSEPDAQLLDVGAGIRRPGQTGRGEEDEAGRAQAPTVPCRPRVRRLPSVPRTLRRARRRENHSTRPPPAITHSQLAANSL